MGNRETERVASIFRNEKNGSKKENIIKKKKPLKRQQMAVNMTYKATAASLRSQQPEKGQPLSLPPRTRRTKLVAGIGSPSCPLKARPFLSLHRVGSLCVNTPKLSNLGTQRAGCWPQSGTVLMEADDRLAGCSIQSCPPRSTSSERPQTLCTQACCRVFSHPWVQVTTTSVGRCRGWARSLS